ncbi:MAG: methylenetetrahydrofolate reductase [Dehalococcoidia bacterium SG8_51_3]|nr:MAG: methylenetetrahydrofolate reductase [Dehalococcoidia bacterium SG8_51_3]
MKAGTKLERILTGGKFAVTAEAGPPKGTSAEAVRKKGELLRHCCDAVNVTDNQTAIVRMSSVAGCLILKQQGIEPVMQMVVRDRNRLALQGDVLGAVALGIGNILCLSGDHQKFGNHPGAKGVFDIDSIQLLQALKMMRDEKKFISGEDVSGEVPVFIGAAANPFADPFEYRVNRLAKKIKAGADFIQTQAIYDVPRFAQWMAMLTERGLDKQVHIMAGVIPIRSAGMARYMRDYVPGVAVPDEIVTRMEKSEAPKEEGVKIILEIIEKLKEMPGVHGIHIMAVGWEDIVPEVVQKSGLMPRPVV